MKLVGVYMKMFYPEDGDFVRVLHFGPPPLVTSVKTALNTFKHLFESIIV